MAMYRRAQIPAGTDIVVTHTPAHNILDGSPNSDEHEGDRELLEMLERVQPILHVCGHVHTGYGTFKRGRTFYVNAALFDEGLGGVERDPIVVDLERLKLAK